MEEISLPPIVDHAIWFAARFCFGLPFPSNGFYPSRMHPMPADIRQAALDVAGEKDCYSTAAALTRMFPADLKYVVGFAGSCYPVEHAWVKFDTTIYYDPTLEFWGSYYPSCVPVFEVSASDLANEMAARGSVRPPKMWNLVAWTNKQWSRSRQR